MLRQMLDRLRHPESFLGPVLTLVSGTAVAHGITALTLVALTRLYSPDDFGILGLFSGIFYILAAVACLRFDVAIPLPKEESDARDIFWLALGGTFFLAALLAILLALIPAEFWVRVNLVAVTPYLWLLPISIIAVGIFTALQSWHVRQRSYVLIAQARVAQSAGASTIQIASGIAAPSPAGLITGFIVNGGAAALLVLGRMWRQGTLKRLYPDLSRLPRAFRRYSYYPRYSVWEGVANSAAVQLPILLIGAYSPKAEVGFLLLALNVVQAPMALFGTATAQVFISQAPEKARQGKLAGVTRASAASLAKVGIALLVPIGLLSPVVFPLAFGQEWARAGILAAWMAPWLIVQFVASPLSMALYILERQRLAFGLHLVGLTIRVGMTWAGILFFQNRGAEAYALSGLLFYGMMIFLILHLTGEVAPKP